MAQKALHTNGEDTLLLQEKAEEMRTQAMLNEIRTIILQLSERKIRIVYRFIKSIAD